MRVKRAKGGDEGRNTPEGGGVSAMRWWWGRKSMCAPTAKLLSSGRSNNFNGEGTDPMATYKQIQEHTQNEYGYVPKTCWIAHVMSDYGLTRRTAPNRQSADKRTNPCPPNKRPSIEQTLKHFGML
ncbi:hypothetical protein [Henriciella marina]|uniref:hypothetical protein n=1 Tax=Henriciella marina TaxID=453851 RepID=UPI0022B203E7|nr:hypothetical protein [Henriciella marina]